MCVFQVDLLDTILVANDMLVEEMKENMDNMTKLFEEYKKAGYKPPRRKGGVFPPTSTNSA